MATANITKLAIWDYLKSIGFKKITFRGYGSSSIGCALQTKHLSISRQHFYSDVVSIEPYRERSGLLWLIKCHWESELRKGNINFSEMEWVKGSDIKLYIEKRMPKIQKELKRAKMDQAQERFHSRKSKIKK